MFSFSAIPLTCAMILLVGCSAVDAELCIGDLILSGSLANLILLVCIPTCMYMSVMYVVRCVKALQARRAESDTVRYCLDNFLQQKSRVQSRDFGCAQHVLSWYALFKDPKYRKRAVEELAQLQYGAVFDGIDRVEEYMTYGQYERALEVLYELHEQFEESRWIYNQLLGCLKPLGKYKEALKVCEQMQVCLTIDLQEKNACVAEVLTSVASHPSTLTSEEFLMELAGIVETWVGTSESTEQLVQIVVEYDTSTSTYESLKVVKGICENLWTYLKLMHPLVQIMLARKYYEIVSLIYADKDHTTRWAVIESDLLVRNRAKTVGEVYLSDYSKYVVAGAHYATEGPDLVLDQLADSTVDYMKATSKKTRTFTP